MVGCVLAAPDLIDGFARTVVAVVLLVGYTLFRTVVPVRTEPTVGRQIELVLEAGGIGLLVAATGYFSSPIAFSLLTAVAVAGFDSGFGASVRLAAATSLAIGIPNITDGEVLRDDIRLSAQWAFELVLVALVAAYARRISGDADARHELDVNQMSRLADANDLLFDLHQVAQELPASLDLAEVLDQTIGRMRELVHLDSAAVVLLEDSDGTWSVARRFGGPAPAGLLDPLPAPLRRAVSGGAVITVDDLLLDGPGLVPKARSGAYAGLVARGTLVGVLVAERHDSDPFDDRDRSLIEGLAEPAALALDNARWFARLRTVGADEERTRIARDLHDRIGQSLAYIAFELDRIVRKDQRGDAVTPDLHAVREDVRGVVREVRDTLYDLRTDVSDDRTVADVLGEFAHRITERSGMEVHLRVEESARLPRPQERELWRIAQEAMVNAERHSKGRRIDVHWHADGRSAVAEVRDDGEGMPIGTAGRLDSYGMVGMRERAASIGATLAIDSIPREGVTVRVTLRPRT